MATPEQRTAAGRALFAKVLAEEVAREVKRARAAVEPTLVAGERVKATLPDGRVVGSLLLTEQPESVYVADPEALLEYVRRKRPDEIVVTESIRSSYLEHLKAEAKRQLSEEEHGGLVVDKDGEVVPGLELSYGAARYVPTVSAPGRRIIRQTLAKLLGSDLREALELEAPEEAP